MFIYKSGSFGFLQGLQLTLFRFSVITKKYTTFELVSMSVLNTGSLNTLMLLVCDLFVAYLHYAEFETITLIKSTIAFLTIVARQVSIKITTNSQSSAPS